MNGTWRQKLSSIGTLSPMMTKQAKLRVHPGYWEFVRGQLDEFNEPFKSESSLRDPFAVAFRSGHNAAICGASDSHAEMRSKAGGLEGDPIIGNSDFVFVYRNTLVGIIELETWWKKSTRRKLMKSEMITLSKMSETNVKRARTNGGRSSRTSCRRASVWVHGS